MSGIAERLRAGDVTALDALLAEHWPPLVHYLLRRTGDLDAAKDMAQETFIRVWERRGQLDPARSLTGYLYRAARHLAIDERRRREVRDRWAKSAGTDPEEKIDSRTPLALLERSELLDTIEAAIERLPGRRREAFILVYVQGLSHREAADVMGNTPHTVANQVSAALMELRDRLRPILENPFELPATRLRRVERLRVVEGGGRSA